MYIQLWLIRMDSLFRSSVFCATNPLQKADNLLVCWLLRISINFAAIVYIGWSDLAINQSSAVRISHTFCLFFFKFKQQYTCIMDRHQNNAKFYGNTFVALNLMRQSFEWKLIECRIRFGFFLIYGRFNAIEFWNSELSMWKMVSTYQASLHRLPNVPRNDVYFCWFHWKKRQTEISICINWLCRWVGWLAIGLRFFCVCVAPSRQGCVFCKFPFDSSHSIAAGINTRDISCATHQLTS